MELWTYLTLEASPPGAGDSRGRGITDLGEREDMRKRRRGAKKIIDRKKGEKKKGAKKVKWLTVKVRQVRPGVDRTKEGIKMRPRNAASSCG